MNKRLKIAITGSSITWGAGLMDDSYPHYVDEYIRTNLSDTILHDTMQYKGNYEILKNIKFYKKSAAKLLGADSSVSFEMSGNELTVCTAMERSNKGVCEIELYVDGLLYDTFTNDNKYSTANKNVKFECDGIKNVFNLGYANTFNHITKLNGKTLNGGINCEGYGGKFDKTKDYMVIMKYTKNDKGDVIVNHALWFEKPPQKGSCLSVSFDYGENILYTKASYGETEEEISSPTESLYGAEEFGDVFTSGDISCGLEFRCTDERSVKTWDFNTYKTRRFTFKIKKALDNHIPYFIINFAANRFHSFMNAGIGGWTANKLLTHEGLNNYKEILKFNPDILFIEEGTNDDWDFASFKAVRRYENIEREDVLKIPAIWLKECKYSDTGKYNIKTSVLKIKGVTKHSVTIDSENTEFEPIMCGDVVAIGTYKGDNRTIVSRKIDVWDEFNKTAYFTKPISAQEIYGISDLSELVGQEARIKSFDSYAKQINTLIDLFRLYNPSVQIALISTGLSNFYTRLLMGYDIKLKDISLNRACYFVGVYQKLLEWQYNVEKDLECKLVKENEGSYLLVDQDGKDINESLKICGLRNYSVNVNGVDYLEKGYCYIDGGYGNFFEEKHSGKDLEITNYKSNKSGWNYIPTKLVFTQNAPEDTDVIQVMVSSKKWSADDCHMIESPYGAIIYSEVVNNTLKNIVENIKKGELL